VRFHAARGVGPEIIADIQAKFRARFLRALARRGLPMDRFRDAQDVASGRASATESALAKVSCPADTTCSVAGFFGVASACYIWPGAAFGDRCRRAAAEPSSRFCHRRLTGVISHVAVPPIAGIHAPKKRMSGMTRRETERT
jgi:hypothetical protein